MYIFINSKNSKTSDPHRQILNLSDKINVKISDKCVALSNLYMEKYKKVTHKQSFKISAQTWNDKFKLPVG